MWKPTEPRDHVEVLARELHRALELGEALGIAHREPGHVHHAFALSLEILDNTPLHKAAVNFRPSNLGGDKLRTRDNSSGSVTVVETPSGGRTITVDVEVIRWGPIF